MKREGDMERSAIAGLFLFVNCIPARRCAAEAGSFSLLVQRKGTKRKDAPTPCPLCGCPALLGRTGAAQLNLRAARSGIRTVLAQTPFFLRCSAAA